ncbi:MAG: caspase family protein [Gammaproteobacteria bacterium]|nr:caspase family protein [Gammaproteobacteria bacterium]
MSLSSREEFLQIAPTSSTTISNRSSSSSSQALPIGEPAASSPMMTFEIKNFSQKGKQRLVSDKKLIHGKYWELAVDPESNALPGYISIYLAMNEISSFCYVNGNGVNYTYTLSVIHPTNPSENVCRRWEHSVFDHKNSSHGFDFLELSKLNDYLSNDTLLIECMIHSEYKNIYAKPSTTINESLSMEDSVLLTDQQDYYPIQNGSHAKGYVCIIRNSQFDNRIFPTLAAYETDIEKIYSVCTTNLAINDKDIEKHHNLSSTKILEVFDNLSKKDFTSYDYLMIFILSHGYSGCIIGTDAVTIPYLHLQQYFYPSKCHSLKEKPKCFFLQGCRTQSSPSSTGNTLGSGGSHSKTNKENKSNVSLPNVLALPSALPIEPTKSTLSIVIKPHNFSEEEADFLFACACVDFSIAWTNTVTGSWYITQLCKCLAYFSHSHHLLDMLIKVNQLLYKMNKDVERYGAVSQISVPSHTFTRKLRFFKNKENEQTEINIGSAADSSSSIPSSSSNKNMLYTSAPTKNFVPATETKEDQQTPLQKLADKRLSYLIRKFGNPEEGSPSKRADLLYDDPAFLNRLN